MISMPIAIKNNEYPIVRLVCIIFAPKTVLLISYAELFDIVTIAENDVRLNVVLRSRTASQQKTVVKMTTVLHICIWLFNLGLQYPAFVKQFSLRHRLLR